MSGIQEDRAPQNVLAQHHKTNRSNKPPDVARLSAAAQHQAEGPDQDNEDNPQETGSEDDGQDQDHGNQDHARAARHSKSTGEVKADTMTFYKGTPWFAILTQAKIKYRRHIALNHGFPDRDEDLGDARDILREAIEEFKGKNEVLDYSGFYSLYIYIRTLIIL
jgi:hypothetical protein